MMINTRVPVPGYPNLPVSSPTHLIHILIKESFSGHGCHGNVSVWFVDFLWNKLPERICTGTSRSVFCPNVHPRFGRLWLVGNAMHHVKGSIFYD